MLSGLGIEVSVAGVAGLYQDFLDVFIIDTQDASQRGRLEQRGLTVIATDTIMSDMEKSLALARVVVEQGHQKRHRRNK